MDCFDYEKYIKNNFKYNAETGIITRTDRKKSNGSIDKYGYLILKIKGRQFKAHRVAWFLYYGKFPEKMIDHINRDKMDNRIKNLRDVDASVNIKNRYIPPNKDTGVVGIYFDSYTKGLKKKYVFRYKGKLHRCLTLEEAIIKKERLENGN